jgi:hypothetical protein
MAALLFLLLLQLPKITAPFELPYDVIGDGMLCTLAYRLVLSAFVPSSCERSYRAFPRLYRFAGLIALLSLNGEPGSGLVTSGAADCACNARNKNPAR